MKEYNGICPCCGVQHEGPPVAMMMRDEQWAQWKRDADAAPVLLKALLSYIETEYQEFGNSPKTATSAGTGAEGGVATVAHNARLQAAKEAIKLMTP